MPRYSYTAQNTKGKTERGMLTAASTAELQRELKKKDLLLLTARDEDNTHVAARRFHDNQLAEFSRQIGTLVGSGVSLARALSILAQQETLSVRERAVYQQVLTSVRQGNTLSDSMEAQGGAFPDLLVNMFRSAETAGNLDKVSMRMAAHYDKQWRLNQKVKSAMAYPRLLLVLLIAAVAIIVGFVLPQFEELFSQLSVLPLPTRILLGISRFFTRWWLAVLLGAAAVYVLLRLLYRVNAVHTLMDKARLHAPVFGRVNRVVVTARFARSLASLYSSGIPIVTCLTIARRTIGNRYIESQFDEVIARVKNGENLSDALSGVDGFMKKLQFSIRVGEETGALDSMLDSIADTMEFESETAINRMVGYLEPAMIILMALLVGFVMLSVLLPIYSSYDAIAANY